MENEFVLPELNLLKERTQNLTEYPFSIPSIRALDQLDLRGPVTFFVGENGSGKSTLLEAIAVKAGFNPEGGRYGLQFTSRSTHSELHDVMQLAWKGSRRRGYFLRAETFYGALTAVEDAYEDSGLPRPDFHRRSHGELFLEELERGAMHAALHAMDEPESALSVVGQLRLLRLMHFGVAAGGQCIVSTHSPILLAYPHARIYRLDGSGISSVAYEETEQYQLTKSFLDAPDRFLRDLFVE
jgi:predicted ATPase